MCTICCLSADKGFVEKILLQGEIVIVTCFGSFIFHGSVGIDEGFFVCLLYKHLMWEAIY